MLATAWLALLLIGSPAGSVHAQDDAHPGQLTPTHADLDYGATPHPARRLDVYLADSTSPTPVMLYLHGGGWRAGSKYPIPGFLQQAVREGWLSVVAVEYRFTDVAPHPAQVQDCARALQFTRHHADEWNVDPKRVGLTGGSAGGHLSLWLALRDDLADPEAKDPIARQSTRVSLALNFAGPTDWSLLSEVEHVHPAYRQLLGYKPGTPAEEMDAAAKADVSPLHHVTADDPYVAIYHGENDRLVPVRHATDLNAALEEAGVPVEMLLIEGAGHEIALAQHPKTHQHALLTLKRLLLENAQPASASRQTKPAQDATPK